MKTVISFVTPPHGTSSGREGLDALLALSAFHDEAAVLFMGQGVRQIAKDQCPAGVLSRNHAKTFGLLGVYGVDEIYVLESSLSEENLALDDLLLPVRVISSQEAADILASGDVRMVF